MVSSNPPLDNKRVKKLSCRTNIKATATNKKKEANRVETTGNKSKNKKDLVSISSKSTSLQTDPGVAKKNQAIRSDLVKKFKEDINQGNYKVKTNEIAEKIIQKYKEQVYHKPYKDNGNFVKIAGRLAEELKSSNNHGVVWANQFDNTANAKGHYETTGPEIWDQTDGKIDGFVCSSGTGGTIGGVSCFLKEKNKDIKIFLSDPTGSALYNYIKNGELKSEGGSITEGIGSSRVTANFAEAKIDGAFSISDQESLPILYDLIQNEGLSLGTSCGVNIAGAIRLGKELGPGKTIVTILCDKSDKYNSKMFNKKFLQEKDLPYPNWL